MKADRLGGFTFADPGGHLIPEVALASPCGVSDAIAANTHAGVSITSESIRSFSKGERMDRDWTMMTIFGAHPPIPRPRQDTGSDDPDRE